MNEEMKNQEILIDVRVKGLKKVKKVTLSFQKLNEEIEKTIQLMEQLNDLN
ncbi:hypothetical protein [Limosilactobacillus gorillae]|jgi:hypothetical protein|uniref:hypothetical protein n=1 Tax=Limosilactobacillus gorillae TaxID=1450649 RepID=UPI000AD12437|nr:hypothetical protein [Limosilactobacillus gorillae]